LSSFCTASRHSGASCARADAGDLGEKDTPLLPSLSGLNDVVPMLTIKRVPEGTPWMVRERPADVGWLIREFLAQE
jgi:hypothetical protein